MFGPLTNFPKNCFEKIEHFFVSYNQLKDKEFIPLGRFGPKRALRLVRKGILMNKKTRH